MELANIAEQIYYISKHKNYEADAQEYQGYIVEQQDNPKQFDFTESLFEPYQQDYSRHPDSRVV